MRRIVCLGIAIVIAGCIGVDNPTACSEDQAKCEGYDAGLDATADTGTSDSRVDSAIDSSLDGDAHDVAAGDTRDSSPETDGSDSADTKETCVPLTTCPTGKNCGNYPDGCGGTVNCGDPKLCPVTCSNNACATVASADVGGAHTCAVLSDHTARCWGYNASGQLGDGTSPTDHLSPVAVVDSTGAPLSDVTQISTGNFHTCVLRAGGSVMCFGQNLLGEIGDGTTFDRKVATAVIDAAGSPLTGAKTISCGDEFSCALITDGTVKCWGDNRNGELGAGVVGTSTAKAVLVSNSSAVTLTGVTEIDGGQDHMCARMSDGTLQCWGDNSAGQLGDGTIASRSSPAPVLASVGVTLTGASEVVAAGQSTCALTTSGAGKCWGRNDMGTVGDNTTTERHFPVSVVAGPAGGTLSGIASLSGGNLFACSVSTSNFASCWGNNGDHELSGPGTTNLPYPNTIMVDSTTALSGVMSIATGSRDVCAVLADGTMRCWGYNAKGQIGDGTTTTRPYPVSVLWP